MQTIPELSPNARTAVSLISDVYLCTSRRFNLLEWCALNFYLCSVYFLVHLHIPHDHAILFLGLGARNFGLGIIFTRSALPDVFGHHAIAHLGDDTERSGHVKGGGNSDRLGCLCSEQPPA